MARIEKSQSLLFVPSSLQADLGSYIFNSNPYDAGIPPKGTWQTPGGAPGTITFYTGTGPHDEPYMLDFPGTELHEKPGQWKFKYADHFVDRAVRIPYMYYEKSKADPSIGILVRDYFLVGFEGGAGY